MSHPGLDEREPIRSLQRLAPLLRAAFAAACAERLLPAYAAYTERTGWGAPQHLAAMIDRLWLDLQGEPMSLQEAQENIDRCLGLIPDADEQGWVPELPAADDAAAATAYALRCRQKGDAQDAAWAAHRVYEAIDERVMQSQEFDTSRPGIVDRLLAHPWARAELARQRRDLGELLGLTDAGDTQEVIARLRDRARREAEHLFG